MISAVADAAAAGMLHASADAARAGDHVVQDGDFVAGLVNLTRAEHAFSASTSVFRTAEEMSGTLFDLIA